VRDAVPQLERTALEARRDGWLVRGRWSKADLWTSHLDDGTPVVVKDFAGKPFLARPWARVQIAREARFLRLLAETGVVPRLLGRIGKDALVLEHLGGTPLHRHRKGDPGRAEYLPRIAEALARVHALGVVHLDLRGRENVHVAEGDRIVILDWAGAIAFRPGSLAHRLIFPRLRRVDEAALVKWKVILAPDTLTEEDRRFLARYARWRLLWPFNRKGLGRSSGVTR